MHKGKIVMVDERGFGFISGEWQNVLFDQSAVERGEFHLLSVGEVVEYEVAGETDPCCGVQQALSVRIK